VVPCSCGLSLTCDESRITCLCSAVCSARRQHTAAAVGKPKLGIIFFVLELAFLARPRAGSRGRNSVLSQVSGANSFVSSYFIAGETVLCLARSRAVAGPRLLPGAHMYSTATAVRMRTEQWTESRKRTLSSCFAASL
jgi:hypothetical protein